MSVGCLARAGSGSGFGEGGMRRLWGVQASSGTHRIPGEQTMTSLGVFLAALVFKSHLLRSS